MRSTMKWVVSGAIIATTIGISACQRPEDPRTAFQTSATVTITANCTQGNQVEVAVDQWVLRMKKKGEVTFVAQSTSGAAISVTQKTAAQWPFDEAPPFGGNAKGKIKDKNGDYRYDVRVACSIGTTGDSVRVVIDPDIIVN